ncbi:hypothetical protein BDY21DRAFT_128338 [Lineolata rhizophorae]|uniref:Uncharacterized protein n=1 Tax=Lineolata rhizophorae TaxID=578093 RepID=A0A6A6NNE9_9PEZI|nr:hypothetical protein BDY21DRAFT_128338 [Lineolata rhizophorae]
MLSRCACPRQRTRVVVRAGPPTVRLTATACSPTGPVLHTAHDTRPPGAYIRPIPKYPSLGACSCRCALSRAPPERALEGAQHAYSRTARPLGCRTSTSKPLSSRIARSRCLHAKPSDPHPGSSDAWPAARALAASLHATLVWIRLNSQRGDSLAAAPALATGALSRFPASPVYCCPLKTPIEADRKNIPGHYMYT